MLSAFSTVLVANRGEIARRVIRTCRSQGFGTVAVYSDADADLPWVREADRAACIGGGVPSASYLDGDAVLAAAKRTGADAIHPGYGFLAENAEFAEKVVRAGLTWIGPTPVAMRCMASKANARRIAVEHDVPVVPGFDRDLDDLDQVRVWADGVGWPLLVKASAGGGGRGMRLVAGFEALSEALASAEREALSAFGDGTLLIEKYVARPRHIEVQVLGDQHGRVMHLGERECSVQRRYQKVIEEAPSPAVSADLRLGLGAAAVRLASAVGYVGAGTVEFIVDADEPDQFYFLEMNTRLQVEHPVTEEVIGIDLVEWQLRVAAGQALPTLDLSTLSGHAFEARIYAEDPMRDYLPGAGPIHRLDLDGPGVRVDAGYGAGDAVGIHYDAMIAKLICHGPDRITALRRMRRAVDNAWVPGVVNNLPLLREVFRNPAFEAGDLDTHFLGREGLPSAPPLNLERGIVAATLIGWVSRSVQGALGQITAGWRLDGPAWQSDEWSCFTESAVGQWRHRSGSSLDVRVGDETFAVTLLDRVGDRFFVDVDGVRQTWRIICVADTVFAHFGDGEAMVSRAPRFPPPAALDEDPGSCVAPTPGVVIAVRVSVGDRVSRGQVLVTVEAMKMEHAIASPSNGVVQSVRVQTGDSVDEGALLVAIDADEAGD